MQYDVIIIGGGPAGLSAGIYACRAGMKTLLIEKFVPGGQAATTGTIDNYPGFEEGISGMELAMKMEAHARRFGLEVVSGTVKSLRVQDEAKEVTVGKETYTAPAVILAMGGKHRHLDVPGEEEFLGRGVSYCATCDGAFFRGKRVAVIGGGNVAVEDAMVLSRYAEQVYLVHRRQTLRADRILQDELRSNDKIQFLPDRRVEEILGSARVESLRLADTQTGKEEMLPVDGIFIAVGQEADNAIVQGLVEMDEKGFILTDEGMQTSVKGVFAAGDIRSKGLRQVVTAVADGAAAAVSASQLLGRK